MDNVTEMTDDADTDEYKIVSNGHITKTCRPKARDRTVKNTASMEMKTE